MEECKGNRQVPEPSSAHSEAKAEGHLLICQLTPDMLSNF